MTDLNYICSLMDTGCCLWIGAGLTVQIAGDPRKAPTWKDLTSRLELEARITPNLELDYPTRLDRCCSELGAGRFKKLLRQTYYTEISLILLRQAQQALETDNFIPRSMRQIACLGQIANPIVNFNIEPFTSILLARPAGPARVIPYTEPNVPEFSYDEPAAGFRRLVYHPHGLATGSTVMTRSEYQAQGNTLAFALAVHAAFGTDLAIVGMSLEDDYLREQITRFRKDIGSIYWFNSEFPEALAKWAQSEENNVQMVPVDWSEFWNWWLRDRSHEINEENLCAAWYRTLSAACDELAGGAVSSLARSFPEVAVDGSMMQLAQDLGESGVDQLSKELSRVVGEVGKRINQKGFGLPMVASTFGPA